MLAIPTAELTAPFGEAGIHLMGGTVHELSKNSDDFSLGIGLCKSFVSIDRR